MKTFSSGKLRYKSITLLLFMTLIGIVFTAISYELSFPDITEEKCRLELYVKNRSEFVSRISYTLVASSSAQSMIDEAKFDGIKFVDVSSAMKIIFVPRHYGTSPFLKRFVPVKSERNKVDAVLFRIEFNNGRIVYRAVSDWHPRARDSYIELDLLSVEE